MDELENHSISLWKLIFEDLECNGHWLKPGFHALAVHRFGVWVARRSRLLRAILKPLYHTLQYITRTLYGIELATTTVVGRRLVIGHQGATIFNHRAVVGDDCFVLQNATIGEAPGVKGAPRLGNRVLIGAGAVIIGNIHVGDDVRIGPNAVVMTDVPPGATVMAPPSRVIRNLRKKTKANAAIEEPAEAALAAS